MDDAVSQMIRWGILWRKCMYPNYNFSRQLFPFLRCLFFLLFFFSFFIFNIFFFIHYKYIVYYPQADNKPNSSFSYTFINQYNSVAMNG